MDLVKKCGAQSVRDKADSSTVKHRTRGSFFSSQTGIVTLLRPLMVNINEGWTYMAMEDASLQAIPNRCALREDFETQGGLTLIKSLGGPIPKNA